MRIGDIVVRIDIGSVLRQWQEALARLADSLPPSMPATEETSSRSGESCWPTFLARPVDLYASPQRDRAERRARKLLMQLLSPTQRRHFRRDGAFVVRGNAGGLFYLSLNEQMVWAVKANGVTAQYCLQPEDLYTPPSDRLIAWKLMVEADEMRFRRRANLFPEDGRYTDTKEMKRLIQMRAAEDLQASLPLDTEHPESAMLRQRATAHQQQEVSHG